MAADREMENGTGCAAVPVLEVDRKGKFMSVDVARIPADDFLGGIGRMIGGALGCALITIDGIEYECWHDPDAGLSSKAAPAALAREFPGAPPLVLFAPIVFARRTAEGAPLPVEFGEICMIEKWLVEGQLELAEYLDKQGLLDKSGWLPKGFRRD